MTLALVVLLAVAVPLAWWAMHRTIAYRREAALREARVLEALFVAREAADGGASIDVEQIFGRTSSSPASVGADAVSQFAAVQAEAFALSRKAPVNEAEAPPRPPAPVRDLVQVFYEARGFRSERLADPSARPIQAVLAHKADSQRAYAFAPLTERPSEAALRSIVARAHGMGQKRVLITVEGALTPGVELPAHGVRLLDRAAIETQLARLDVAVADRIRAKACQRAGQRLTAG